MDAIQCLLGKLCVHLGRKRFTEARISLTQNDIPRRFPFNEVIDKSTQVRRQYIEQVAVRLRKDQLTA